MIITILLLDQKDTKCKKKLIKKKWIFISLLKSTKSIDMMFDVGNGCRMDFAKFQVLPDHI